MINQAHLPLTTDPLRTSMVAVALTTRGAQLGPFGYETLYSSLVVPDTVPAADTTVMPALGALYSGKNTPWSHPLSSLAQSAT